MFPRRIIRVLLVGVLAGATGLLVGSGLARAQGGHGPAFGLATPTLPQGGWNYNATLMSVGTGERGLMTRQSLWYGLTEHLQLNASVPVSLRSPAPMPTTRGGTMMGGLSALEASVYWRFHRQYLGVGKRFESTLLISGLYPTRDYGRDRRAGPGVHLAAVTGYASRSVYAWAGGGMQHYTPREGNRPGDLQYGSLVFGWRPAYFRRASTPDWRLFVEGLAESVGPERQGGSAVAGSGGEKLFVGPSTLGLYGAWGLSLGVLLPIYQDVPEREKEGPRPMVNFTYWF
jgi:hypothetical protein